MVAQARWRHPVRSTLASGSAFTLDASDVIVTSTEPKARETGAIVARELGVSVCEASDHLHEQERSSVPLLSSAAEFRARVIEALSRPSELVFGDESVAAAHRRFSAGVQHAVRRSARDFRLDLRWGHGLKLATRTP